MKHDLYSHKSTPRAVCAEHFLGIINSATPNTYKIPLNICIYCLLFLLVSMFVSANYYTVNLTSSYILDDTNNYQAFADTNYGTESSLFVNKANLYDRQGLIKYNVASLNTSINVTNALFYFYVESLNTDNNTIYFYQLFQNYSWTELSNTWNLRPNLSQFSTNSINATNITGIGWYVANLTSAFNNCSRSSYANCSFIMNGTVDAAVEIDTKEAIPSRVHYTTITYFIDDNPNSTNFLWVNGTNRTLTNVGFNITFSDDAALSSYKVMNNMSNTWTNGTATAITGLTNTTGFIFNLSNTTVGKNICFQVWFNDSKNNATLSNVNCLNVANTVPNISAVSINSTDFSKNSLYNGLCNSSDADNTTITTYFYQWFKNGALNKSGSVAGPFILNKRYSIDFNGNFSDANTIIFSCLAYDGTGNSSWINSSSIKINSTPTIVTATITPDPAVDADDLECNPIGATDADGDAITYSYNWFKNTISQNIYNSTLKAGNTSTNDNWYCTVNVTDIFYTSSTVNSQTVTIGSSFTAPSITYVNATSNTTVNSTFNNPTFNNTYLTLQANISDPNTEKWTTIFCKSNQFTNSVCTGGEWNRTTANSTTKLQSTTINVNTLSGNYDYYAFAIDNASYVSPAKFGNFSVDTPPYNITFNGTSPLYTNAPNGSILFTGSDLEGDTMNFSIYSIILGSYSPLGDIANIFDYNDVPEGTVSFWAIPTDQHGYQGDNSTIWTVVADYTKPSFNLTTPTGGLTSRTVSASWQYYDLYPSNCYYNVSLQSSASTLYLSNSIVACSATSTSFILSVDGSFVFNMCAYDLAGNINCSSSNFSVSTSVAPGGGGSAGDTYYNTTVVNQTVLTNTGVTCNQNFICEQGETFFGCDDCRTTKSPQVVLLFIVALVASLIYYSQNKEQVQRYIKMPKLLSGRRRR